MKKLISAILCFAMLAGCFSASATTLGEAQANIWKSRRGGIEAEQKESFDTALVEYNKFIEYASYLEKNNGENHWENIKGISALTNHLEGTPELYVEAAKPADAKFYGAKYEPRYGAFVGKCDEFAPGKESAYLLYVRFGSETVKAFEYMLPENKDIYLVVCWNLPNENKSDLDMVNSGSMDEYIISNLKHISSMPQKILLRFGAEVNCWDMPSDKAQRDAYIESYKSAFRRVTKYARQYAPNVAMVYSPNDISNWYVDAEDFYPGDEYVDWVGISTYSNLTSAAEFERANPNDAYYCRGYYDNPIVKIKNIVDSFGDTKPIFISECGFAYGSSDGLQTEAHAVEQMNKFYSYVTMVYPQVKGVMLFNAQPGNLKYKLSGSAALADTYNRLLTSNISFGTLLDGGSRGYTRFATFNEKTDKLRLHLYAEFPTPDKTSVGYSLDGAGVPHMTTPPYSATVDVSKLSQGRHVLKVAVSNGGYYREKEYVFYVGAGNYVAQTEQGAKNSPVTVTLDGREIQFTQPPVIDNGRTLVPLRAIFESLGATVDWDASTKTVTSRKDGKTVVMQIGSDTMSVNGAVKTLDVPAKLVNDSTMVPVRAVSEAYDCNVTWDGNTRTVVIVR